MRRLNRILCRWGRTPLFPVATFAALLTLAVLLGNDIPMWRGVTGRVLSVRGRIDRRHYYGPGDTRVYYHFYLTEHGSQIRHNGADFTPPMRPQTRVTVFYADADHKVHSLHLPLRLPLIEGVLGVGAFLASIVTLLAAVPILVHFFSALWRKLRWLAPLLPVVAREESRRLASLAARWGGRIGRVCPGWPNRTPTHAGLSALKSGGAIVPASFTFGRVCPGWTGREPVRAAANPAPASPNSFSDLFGFGRVWPDWRQRMDTPFWMLRYPTGILVFFTLVLFTWGCRNDWLYCLALPYAPIRGTILRELAKLVCLSLLVPIIVSSLWQWFLATRLRLSLWQTEIASATLDALTIFALYWLCGTLDYWMV